MLRLFRTIQDADTVNPETLFAFERFMLAMRRDLGHRNRGLGRKDVLRLFITDIDTIVPDSLQR